MPAVTLTEIALRHLKPPEQGQVIYVDKSFKGFGVRVTAGGAKSYVLTYGTDRRRVTIGAVGTIGLKDAREKARGILHGPQDARTPSFKVVLDRYLETHVRPNNRPATARETERLLTRHFPSLYDRQLAKIATADLLAIIDAMRDTPAEANHAFAAVRSLLLWAVERGYIEKQPLERLKIPHRARSRDRVLTDQELAAVARIAPHTGLYGQIVLTLILTGQRVNQIAQLRRSWIEGDQIRFPASIMKSGREHIVPIGHRAQVLLAERNTDPLFFKDGRPFTNWSDSQRRLLEASGVAHFTRHDLRRTFATGLANLDIPPHVIERLLDHHSGVISGVAAIYNRSKLMQPMREAVEKWEGFLHTLIARAQT